LIDRNSIEKYSPTQIDRQEQHRDSPTQIDRQDQHRDSPTQIDRQRQAQKHISIQMNTKRNTQAQADRYKRKCTEILQRAKRERHTIDRTHKHTHGDRHKDTRHEDQVAHML
jgi:hypothetical protein